MVATKAGLLGETSPRASRRQHAEDVIDAILASRGAFALIVAESGGGKTWVLREMLDILADRGVPDVTAIRCAQTERTVPYALWDRIHSSVSAWFPDMPAPDPGRTSIENAQHVLAYLDSVCAEPRETRLLLVDDVQFVDAESLEMMTYLYPRMARYGVVTIIATRPVPHPRFDRIAEDAQVGPDNMFWRLEPFGPDEIRAHAYDRWGVVIPDEASLRLHQASGGNPLVLDGIMSAITPAEVRRVRSTGEVPLRLTQTARRPFDQMLRGSSRGSLVAVQICAAGDVPLPTSSIEALAERLGQPCDWLDAVKKDVLHVVDDGHLEVRHPLIGSTALTLMDPGLLRRLHAILAEQTTGPQHIEHRVQAVEALGPELADEVLQTARSLLVECHADVGQHLLLLALRHAPPSGDLHDRLAVQAAQNATWHGVSHSLDTVLRHVDALADPAQRYLYGVWTRALRGENERAEELLADWFADPDDSDYIRGAQGVACLALAGISHSGALRGHQVEQVRLARLGLDRIGPDAPDECRTLQLLLEVVVLHGRWESADMADAQALAQRLLALDTSDAFTHDAKTLLGQIMLMRGRPRLAVDLFEAIRPCPPLAMPHPLLVNLVTPLHARSLLRLGHVRRATQMALDAIVPAMRGYDLEARAAAPAVAASCQAASGELELARQFLDLSVAETGTQTLCATELLHIARLDVDITAHGLDSDPQEVDPDPSAAGGMAFYQALAAADADAARAAIADLAHVRGPLNSGRSRELWLAHITDPTPASLRRVREFCEKLPGEHGFEAWGLLGAVSASLGDFAEARRAFGRAIAVADACEAPGWATMMREQAERIRAAYSDRVDALTDRERRVCTLARNGMTNAEIGRELNITERTAGFHMSNALKKLGYTSRRELAGLSGL